MHFALKNTGISSRAYCWRRIRSNLYCVLCAGLMEQWLIEGKFSEEEILMQSCDMLAAGIDTVSVKIRIVSKTILLFVEP